MSTAHHIDPAGFDRQLPCGVSLDELLTQVADARAPKESEHQRNCPHCRAALAELTEIWAPVHELAAERVSARGDLLEAVMARVRDLARNPWHAVIPDAAGSLRIAARVVGAVARLATESVPHVTVALGRVRAADPGDQTARRAQIAGPAGEAATAVGVTGTHVVVDVHVAVDYATSIPEVARQVRQQIARDLHDHTGLTTTEVNVHVVDVTPARSPDDRAAVNRWGSINSRIRDET